MSSELFHCKTHLVQAQHIRTYYCATATTEGEELQLAVKQYVPRDNVLPEAGDVTIVACHAAGLFKELYEPMFDELYLSSRKDGSNFRIRGIWIADVATHGQSSILNEGRLGTDVSYDDHSRDLLCMINAFRREMPAPLVGWGHSMGATNILQLALYHPRLFTTVIAFEPIVNRQFQGMNMSPSYWLTSRRDVWPSRAAAIQDSRNNPMTRQWDARVKERWNEYGFRELPTLLHPLAPADVAKQASDQGTTPVTLTTTKHHDARSFGRPCYPAPGMNLEDFQPTSPEYADISKEQHRLHAQPVYRPEAVLVHEQLPFLRPSCLYMYGEKTTFTCSNAAGRADKLTLTGTAAGGSGGQHVGAVAEVILSDIGHFAPLEKPRCVAEVTAPWLANEIRKWKERRAIQSNAWDQLSVREKAMVDDAWYWWVKEWYARKSRKSKPDPKFVASKL